MKREVVKKSYFINSAHLFVTTYTFPKKWVVYAGYFRGRGECEPYHHVYAYKCSGSDVITEYSFKDGKCRCKNEYRFTDFSEPFITNEEKIPHGIPKVLWDAIEERKLGWKYRKGPYPKGWVSMQKRSSTYKTQITIANGRVSVGEKCFREIS